MSSVRKLLNYIRKKVKKETFSNEIYYLARKDIMYEDRFVDLIKNLITRYSVAQGKEINAFNNREGEYL